MSDQKSFVKIALIGIIVILLGTVTYLAFVKKSKLAVEKITSPQTFDSTQTPNPGLKNYTAEWKTYINTEYGFEFLYPSNWIFDDQSATRLGGVDVFVFPSGDNDFGKNTMNVIIDTLHTLSERRQSRISYGYQEKVISLGGGTLYTYSKNGVQDGMHFFTAGDKVFQISFDPYNPTITKIISTFKFKE